MERNKDGIFQRSGFDDSIVVDSYFSLLKFEKPDDDLNLNCLAGRFPPSMQYIIVFPVDCETRMADAYFCSMVYLECAKIFSRKENLVKVMDRNDGIMEQVNKHDLSFRDV
jgi:hypothetical protein